MKIAMAQMLCLQSCRERNLPHALQLVDRATAAGAELVVLPECSDVGWLADTARDEAQPIDGPYITEFCNWAAEHEIWIGVGWTERAGNRVYNAAVLINSAGRPVLHHRKINVLDIARGLYSIGTSVRVADTAFGRVGLDICADSWVDHITKTMADMGAWLVLSPCAWASEPGKEEETSRTGHQKHYADRTTERDITLVGVSGVGELTEGPWKGMVLQGNSLAYGPGGEQLCRGKTNEEELLVIDVFPAKAG